LRLRGLALVLLTGCLIAIGPASVQAHGGPLPGGFRDTVAIPGLSEPTAVRIAAGGQVFVAEKSGRILLFSGFDDPTPEVFADLRKEVYDFRDRGLLGLALDPEFETRPYVYALYTFDHVLGEDAPGSFPRWGQPPEYEADPCPNPGEPEVDACPVSGRLVRLTAGGGKAVAEKVLIEDWCQQFPSHSVGDLNFGPEGALFASGGEGANFTDPDYGQFGWPHENQCGDPPGGEALAPPLAEGGSLRSLDALTPADPTGLSGSVIRIDPDSGEGLPGNPLYSSLDANARRLIAFGFRNPFRFAIDPEREEVFVGNVGNGTYEEVDRFPLVPGTAYDSGWPCFEGPDPNPGFESLELDLCEGLYAAPGSTAQPLFYYHHGGGVTPDDHCPFESGSAITGMAVYRGGSFPAEYDGALFFADSVRGCIYVILADEGGELDPLTVRPFLTESGPYIGADVQVGPDGNLYYLSLYGDESLHRISYDPGAPIARLSADKSWGELDPDLQIEFDAGGSDDPDGEDLDYAWDLDGDGSFEDEAGGSTRTRTFNAAVNGTVAVRVTDQTGKEGTDRLTVYPGDTPPRIEIEEPLESLTWAVGQPIDFYGKAWAEAGDGTQLPADDLFWRSTLAHCPGGPGACHEHPLRMFPGVETGTLFGPNHDYPSRIALSLTATDSRGLSATQRIELLPRPVELEIRSEPPGVALTAGNVTRSVPFVLTAIEHASVTLAAPETAQVGGETYTFQGWSDGAARVHSLVADGSGSHVAIYSGPSPGPAPPPGGPPPPTLSRPALTGHPARRTVERVARFEFRPVPASAGLRCKLDDGPFKPCHSPRVYRNLRPGRHVLTVVAVAADGGAESAPLVFGWRVLAKRAAR
jgi:glucose/arabinose dehydrogenase